MKRISVRFNLDNQADRRAWDYLQSVSGSRNKAVIDALCRIFGNRQDFSFLATIFEYADAPRH